MNIQRIGEDIIRVSIPKTDLIQRNINVNSLDGKSPDVQELFWYILDKAESEIDFNIIDSQFYVEAIPDSDNGFIATITKVKDNDKDDNDKDDKDDNDKSIQKHIKNKFNDNPVKTPTLNNKRICSSIVIYEFKNLDDVTFLCRQLHSIYTGDSSLFKHSNNYYLLFTKNSLSVTNSKLFELLLAEYGHKAPNAAFLEGYLNEYGTIMIQHNAVKILNDFY